VLFVKQGPEAPLENQADVQRGVRHRKFDRSSISTQQLWSGFMVSPGDTFRVLNIEAEGNLVTKTKC